MKCLMRSLKPQTLWWRIAIGVWLVFLDGFTRREASAGTEVVIRLSGLAEVSPGMVLLGDVATIHTANPEDRARLAKIALAPAAEVGKSITIRHEAIEGRLAAHGVNLGLVELSGRDAVLVKTKPEENQGVITASATATTGLKKPPATKAVISANYSGVKATTELKRLAEANLMAAFHAQFQPPSNTALLPKVKLVASEADFQELASALPGQIHFELQEIRYGGPQPWQVHIGRSGRTAVVTGWVETTPLSVHIKRPVTKGKLIEPNDVELKETSGTRPGYSELADVVGREATRNLQPGEVVTGKDFVESPLVRPNEILTACVRIGGLSVKRPCKSLGTAARNETVMVQPLDDPRTRLQVRMTAFHEGEVIDSPADFAPANDSRVVNPAR